MRQSRAGFTLIEVLISALIFLVVMLAMYQVFDSSHANYASGTRKVNVQQNARLAMEEITRDLRMAGYSPETQATNAQPIRVGTANSIAAIGAWGTPEVASRIRVYCYDSVNKTIRRREYKDDVAASYKACSTDLNDPDDQVIAQGVEAFRLTYYGNDTATPPNPNTLLNANPNGLDNYRLNATLPVAPTTERDRLRAVLVSMTFREDVPHQAPQTYHLTSTIRLRNLHD